MRQIALSPALVIIGSNDTEAAAALAFGLADHFDSSMNRLTERFSQRNHRTPVIDGYVLDELSMLQALQTALAQTVTVVATKPGAIEWREVMKELSPHCSPAVTHIMLTNDEFNSRRSVHEDHFSDTLALPLGIELDAQLKMALTFLRQRRGEIARDPATIYSAPAQPRIIRQDDFVFS